MKKQLLIVFLITLSYSVIAATPFQVRRDNVKVFTSPDFKNALPSVEYFYGDTLPVQVYNDRWAEVILQNESKGYVKRENLLAIKTDFWKLSAEEKIAAPLYRITSATIVFREPDNRSERVSLQFKKHQTLYDAVPVNDEWMSIPIGGGQTGYMRTMYLNKISHEDKVAMFGGEPEQQLETQSATSGLADYVDGGRTGRKFVFVIIAVCVLLLLQTIYRINCGKLRGKALGAYVHTLLLLSLLEIWYFYSTGMDEVYWFLSFEHILRTVLYVAIMIVFTWIQVSAGLNLIDDTVKSSARKKRKYLWIAIGIGTGLALSFLYREIEGIGTAAYRFGPDTLICQIIGQLPAGILFASNLKKRLRPKKILFCIYYMAIAGTAISLVMGSLLIFIVFAVFFALAAARPASPTRKELEAEGNEVINPVCFSCTYFNRTDHTCSIHNDVTSPSCSDQRDGY